MLVQTVVPWTLRLAALAVGDLAMDEYASRKAPTHELATRRDVLMDLAAIPYAVPHRHGKTCPLEYSYYGAYCHPSPGRSDRFYLLYRPTNPGPRATPASMPIYHCPDDKICMAWPPRAPSTKQWRSDPALWPPLQYHGPWREGYGPAPRVCCLPRKPGSLARKRFPYARERWRERAEAASESHARWDFGFEGTDVTPSRQQRIDPGSTH